MSVKYEVLKKLVVAAGLKKRWLSATTEELLENRRKQNAKNRIPALKDDAFEFSRIDVMGFPVLKLIHREHTDRANLFLIGGGMISAPRPASVKKALRFAKETGLDLFIPYYPLCTDYPLTKAYEMIHETYKVMLRDYAPERISVLGTSSGGNLALGMVPYINDGHQDTPMPGYIMAISPGNCVETEEEWQRMLELDKKDVAIPAQYMKTAVEVMRHGDDSVPDYMLWLQRGDFTNCPRVTFIYGSDETLYACAPAFEAAMKKYGVDYRMIVGEGMFHCYTKKAKQCVLRLLHRDYDDQTCEQLWERIQLQYCEFLRDEPPMAGAKIKISIYDPILIFAWYKVVPDKPRLEEVQQDIFDCFMGSFDALGKIFNLNRRLDNRLASRIFQKANDIRVEEIQRFPGSFRMGSCSYDRENRLIRYSFTQCPNAEFAKRHHMEDVLPVMCNCDHLAMQKLHACLIREGTCVESPCCDYCIVGDRHPIAQEHELVKKENGLLVSVKK